METTKFRENCKIHENRENHKIRGFLCETKDHLPKKLTPIFSLLISGNLISIYHLFIPLNGVWEFSLQNW